MHDLKEEYLSVEEMLKFAKKVQFWQRAENNYEQYFGRFQNYKVEVDGRCDSPRILIMIGHECVGGYAQGETKKEKEGLSKLYETIRINQRDLENQKQVNITKIARNLINSLE